MKFVNSNIIILICGAILSSTLFADEDLLQLPNIEEYTLNNGMRVLFSPNYDYPTVYCHLYINSGRLDDPSHGGMLASHMFYDMNENTEEYPKKGQLKEKMQSLGDDGGNIDTYYINNHSMEIGSYFLKEDISSALEVFSEIILHPTFKREGLFWAKIIMPFIPKKNFYQKWGLTNLHVRHLYANIKSDIEPFKSLKFKKQDYQNWHDANIYPENTTLMITGDVNLVYVKNIIENYFENWTTERKASDRAEYNINITNSSDIKMRFINTDFDDAEIRIILRSASNKDDWYLPSELAKTIFNPGENSGRLNNIHEKLDRYGNINQESSTSDKLPWTRINAKVKYSELDNFYDLIVSEFNSLSNNDIDENELKSAKNNISNNIKYKLNEPEDFTKFIQREYNVNGFSIEKIKTSISAINDVKLSDVNMAAERIYNPENFILLVMGNQDSCSTFLNRFEDVEYYEHTEKLRVDN